MLAQYRVLREFTAHGRAYAAGTVVPEPAWCNLPSLERQGFIAPAAEPTSSKPAAKPPVTKPRGFGP